MNQTISDYIQYNRTHNVSWKQIAAACDILYNTSFFDGKEPGEALRSAYRRYKRQNAPQGSQEARSATKRPESVFDAMSGFSAALGGLGQALGASFASERKEATQGNQLPVALPASFEPPLTLDQKSTLVIADLHCPYHSSAAIDTAISAAILNQVEQIVIAGDVFDFASLSRHSKAEVQARLEGELEIAGRVLLHLADYAPIFICNGNHDQRLAARLDVELKLSRVINMALNGRVPANAITVTEYDYMLMGNEYAFGHLSNFSNTPGKIAAQLAQKYHRHTFVGHDHIVGYDTAGKWIGASIGAMTDPSKHWYSQRRFTTYAPWQHGFAIVRDNGFSLYRDGACYFERVKDNGAEWNKIKV